MNDVLIVAKDAVVGDIEWVEGSKGCISMMLKNKEEHIMKSNFDRLAHRLPGCVLSRDRGKVEIKRSSKQA